MAKVNASNYSYNVLSNRENLDEAKKKIIDRVKIDLFETMKMDNIMVDRNDLSKSISENRFNNWKDRINEWIPWWKIKIKDGIEFDSWDKYPELIDEYKRLINEKPNWYESELEKLDAILAERITLDLWFAIEFKSDDPFTDWRSAEQESQKAYNSLNDLTINGSTIYKWKIDLVSKKKDKVDYFVIKRNEKEIAKFNEALKHIEEISKVSWWNIENLINEKRDNEKMIDTLKRKLKELNEKEDKTAEREDLELINKVLQDGGDTALKNVESKLKSTIAKEKYKELYNDMMYEHNRIDYYDMLRKLWDFLEKDLSSWKEQEESNSDNDLPELDRQTKREKESWKKEEKEERQEESDTSEGNPEGNSEKKEGEVLYTWKDGELLISYCNENWITKKDWEKLWQNPKAPYEDIVDGNEFVDSEWNIIKLQILEGEINYDYWNDPEYKLIYTWERQEKSEKAPEDQKKEDPNKKEEKEERQEESDKSEGNPEGNSEKKEGEVLYTWKDGELLISYCNENWITKKDWEKLWQNPKAPYEDIVDGNEFVDSEWNIIKLQILEGEINYDYWNDPEYKLIYTWEKQEKSEKAPKEENKEKSKEWEETEEKLLVERDLPAEIQDTESILKFISEDTWIPIDELKDENKYRVELVPTSDDDAEDDVPNAKYRVYKKLNNTEPKKNETPKEEKPKKNETPKEEKPKKNETPKENIIESKAKIAKAPLTAKAKLSEQRERIATITSVNQVNRAIAQREADEELRERKANLPMRNVFDRANLFLRRQFIKDRLVDKKLWKKTWFDRSESWQFAADRHQIEQQNKLAERMKVVIEDIDKNNYPVTRWKLDKLLDDLTWNPNTVPPRQRSIDDAHFQIEFKSIIEQSWKNYDKQKPSTATSTNWRPISELISKNDMWQLSTNILMQANKFRDHQFMVRDIANYIMLDSLSNKTRIKKAYPNYNSDFDTWCRWRIQTYVNTYNDIPDFLHQMWVNLDDKEATKDIRTLQRHDGALSTISAQTLKLKIQMLNDGWEAYNVKKRDWLAKIWRWLDRPEYLNNKRWREHPNFKEFYWRFRWAVKLWVMAAPWFVAWALWAWPLCIAGVVGWMSALTTLFKKKSHYEKEQRWYQRMQATNLEDYRQKREDLANEVAWMKRYQWRFWWEKARKRNQFRDYVNTTHDQLDLSTELTQKIEKRLQSVGPLDEAQKRYLAADVADWLARLDYHKKTWENFLWSNNPAVAEKEYRALQNAVMWGARRLGAVDANWNPDMEIIRNTDPYSAYYNSTISIIEDWQGDEYNTQWYLKARKRYNTRSNLKAADGALKAWLISFGLSYLATSLASTKEQFGDDIREMTNWEVWWEFHLWDYQEHLLAVWDIDKPMKAVINWDTQWIKGATLFSSVDAAPISTERWLQKLQSAIDSLNQALADPTVAWNPDLSKAIANYATEAHSKISAIPWLSTGNQHLNLARALEDVRTWILEPVIASWNKNIQISPDCLHWVDWWAQVTGSWTVWQAFRNMWIMNIEYLQKVWEDKLLAEAVTRAIPIPVWLNTFWEPKSEVKSAA